MTSSQPSITTSSTFEYPLKENIRGFLRLEYLFNRFERNQLAVNVDSHFLALTTLFEILEILERGDTRSELTKELARLSKSFDNLRQNPQVDTRKLENFLTKVNQLHQWVINYQGKFGEILRREPFIETVKHRASIPGGTCSFDCPELQMFLQSSERERQERLNDWVENIRGVRTSIEVILKILRDNSLWQWEKAPMGSFMIDTPDQPILLLRVRLDQSLGIFPEFSCGKHRSNIHFMRLNELQRKVATQKEVKFELSCCQ